ncbi:hypothetical protein ACVOMV_33850 [Mesorhizobium atlanticum]
MALVLDNSGSMTELATARTRRRFDLLKNAAKQLVDQLAGQALLMKQVSKPVQFSLVPFAASVNVGPANKDAAWMDTTGVSPLDQENLDWSTLTSANSPNQYAVKSGSNYYAKGSAWDASQLNQAADALFDLQVDETDRIVHQGQERQLHVQHSLRADRKLERLRRVPALSLQHPRYSSLDVDTGYNVRAHVCARRDGQHGQLFAVCLQRLAYRLYQAARTRCGSATCRNISMLASAPK